MSPKLAYFHYPTSHSWMFIRATAADLCDLIWVIDSRWDGADVLTRVLRRSGDVVDIAGLDADAAAAAIGRHRPDGVLALADPLLLFCAEVAQRLQLPFLSVPTAVNLTDKLAQRTALARAGVPTPAFWPVPDLADQPAVEALLGEVGFPAILKPRRGEASRDTVKVASAADLRRELEAVSQVRGQDVEFLVEGYIPDRPEDLGATFAGYVSVESITARGQTRHLSVTGRLPLAPPLRETGYYIPSDLPAVEASAVLDLASAAVTAVGVDIGCCHTEIKLTPDGPQVIEVNGRIGGGISEMIEDVSGGYEMLEEAMRVALGEGLGPGPQGFTGVAFLLYVQAPVGVSEVTAVSGVDQLNQLPGVSEVILNRGPGAQVSWREGNHANVCSLRGVSADYAELAELVGRLPGLVRVSGT